MNEFCENFLAADISLIKKKINIFDIETRYAIYKAIVKHFITILNDLDHLIIINRNNKNQLNLFKD